MTNRYALIIAADDYSDSNFAQLHAPLNDAKELADVLSDPDIGEFEVVRLLNKTSPEAKTEIERFFQHRDPEDILLLYFSCHGFKDESGVLYFAMPKTQTGLLDSTAIEASFVNKQIEKSRSRQIVLILDCCYSGAFARGFATKAAATTTAAGAREAFKNRGRVVITSSDALQYAFEDGEIKSGKPTLAVFTEAVVRGLRTGDADLDRDGLVSTDDLYRFVEQEVLARSTSQRPTRLDMLEGTLYVAKAPRQREPWPAGPIHRSTVADGDGGKGAGILAAVAAEAVQADLQQGSEPPGVDAARSHYYRGLRFAQDGDRAAAESEFQQVVAATTSKLVDLAHFNLAVLATGAGDVETALLHCSIAAGSSQQIVAARAALNLGCLHLAAGRTEEALAPLYEAMNYNDSDVTPRAAFLLGQLSEQRGDVSGAWLLYGVVDDHDGHPFAKDVRSRYVELTASASETVAVTRVLSMASYPKPAANALLACGGFYLRKGYREEARICYQRLAELDDTEFTQIANTALAELPEATKARFYPWKRRR
jgi:tetratricopeptide (TPR) repeat protein